MRRKTLALVATAVLVTAGAAFVMAPPFPEPSSLITSDYAALHVRLGPPSVVFGDKFVGWSRSRYVATWTLEAGLEFPLRPQSAGGLNFTVGRLRKRSADVKRVSVISRPRGVCRLDFALPTGSYADARRGQGRIDRCIVAYAYTYTSRNSHFSCFGVMASLFRVGILGLRVSWALCSLGRSLTTTGPSIPRRTPSANWQRFRRGRNHSMRVYLRDESAAVTPSNNRWRGS
jgi:hypothetical protein